jgi:hypothetical protein
MGPVRDLRHERLQRDLLLMAPEQRVLMHWLTGEVYNGPDRESQRRRPYRKTQAKRPRVPARIAA